MRIAFAAAIIAAIPLAAQASDLPLKKAPVAPVSMVKPSGSLYVFGMGGSVVPNTVEASQDVLGSEIEVLVDVDTGYTLSGGIGYNFGNGLRIEGELGHLSVGTSHISLPDFPLDSDADGDISGTYAMANAWYAFDLGAIRPFVGGGVGYAMLNMDSSYFLSEPTDGVDDGDNAFAWQMGAGVEFDIASNISLIARYRYFATGDFTVQDDDNTDVDASLNANIFDIGLRVSF